VVALIILVWQNLASQALQLAKPFLRVILAATLALMGFLLVVPLVKQLPIIIIDTLMALAKQVVTTL